MRREAVISIVLMFVYLVVITFFFSLPFVWLVLSSLIPHNLTPEFKVPKQISFSNYLRMTEPVGQVPPYVWIINSLIISSGSATIATILSVIAAYTLSRYRFKGQSIMLSSFVVFRLVPTIIIALPLMFIFRAWGWLNSIPALILVLAALILPFTLLMLDGYFRSLPIIYEEAALIDGCTRLGAFFRITLPLALPGIAAVWLLAFVFSWGEFIVPLMLIQDVTLYPASVGLYFFYGQHGLIDYGKLSAFAIIYSIPMIVIFAVMQKYFKRGVAGFVTR